MTYKVETLELVRGAIERITGTDAAQIEATKPLNLDSINRISLLVELENTFQMQLGTEDVGPESFESLASLATLIDTLRQEA